jgi:hypothetical protein
MQIRTYEVGFDPAVLTFAPFVRNVRTTLLTVEVLKALRG